MRYAAYLIRVVLYPRRTAREILEGERSLLAAGLVVLGLGALLFVLFLVSHLRRGYPPPLDELETWIETWGEFAMLPLLKIPAERYRLAQALFALPLVLAAWMLMGGSARLLSILFGGKVTYEGYLSLFGFSFYAFWILAHLLDVLYSAVLGDVVLEALRGAYGPGFRAFVTAFPSVMWTAALTVGGISNGIVTHEAEGWAVCKAALTAVATLVWPIVLVSVLIR